MPVPEAEKVYQTFNEMPEEDMSKKSETRKDFDRRFKRWDREYCIYCGNKTSDQAEWLMWVAFQAGAKFAKRKEKGGTDGNNRRKS